MPSNCKTICRLGQQIYVLFTIQIFLSLCVRSSLFCCLSAAPTPDLKLYSGHISIFYDPKYVCVWREIRVLQAQKSDRTINRSHFRFFNFVLGFTMKNDVRCKITEFLVHCVFLTYVLYGRFHLKISFLCFLEFFWLHLSLFLISFLIVFAQQISLVCRRLFNFSHAHEERPRGRETEGDALIFMGNGICQAKH